MRALTILTVLGFLMCSSGIVYACSYDIVPFDPVDYFTHLAFLTGLTFTPSALLACFVLFFLRKRWLAGSWRQLAMKSAVACGWALLGSVTGNLGLALLKQMPLTKSYFFDPCAQDWLTYVSLAFIFTLPTVFVAGHFALLSTRAKS